MKIFSMLAVAALAALSACGGGGGATAAVATPPATTTPTVPDPVVTPPVLPPVPVPTLSQTGNPMYSVVTGYTSWLSNSGDTAAKLTADKTKANNIISWQMPHGGFYKLPEWYAAKWDGVATRSEWYGDNNVELGTIDNNATVTEILFLANVYARSGDITYRDSARKALDFLLNMQFASGGLPQVYPARAGTSYSNYVTFNDNAMVRALVLFDHANQLKAPLDGDVFTATQRARLAPALEKAAEFIIKAQIVKNGVKTVWCAQHDPVDYKPLGARSYELPSKSGNESALVAAFLMSRPQTTEVVAAIKGALTWYRSSAVQVPNMSYDKNGAKVTNTSPFVPKAGSTVWYRFYDLAADTGFFSGRLPTDNPPGTGKQYDIMAIEAERRYGYDWGGNYGDNILAYAAKVGY